MEIQYSTYNFLQICGKLKKFDILENDKSSKYEWIDNRITFAPKLWNLLSYASICRMHRQEEEMVNK